MRAAASKRRDILSATSPDQQNPASGRGFAVLGLGEIAIRCVRFHEMVAFYREVIGLELLADRNGIVFFALPNGVAGHTAVLALFDSRPDGRRPAPHDFASRLHHLALTVDVAGQEAAKAWLDRLGIDYEIETFSWIGWRGLFLRDPDGNTVELVAAIAAEAPQTRNPNSPDCEQEN